LESFKEQGLSMAVISNAYYSATSKILEQLGIEDYFDFYTAPSLEEGLEAYTEKMKPSPEMLEEAAEEVGADNPLVVGDSISDVRSAEAAGYDVAYLSRSHSDKDEKARSKADYVVEGLDELGEIFEGLNFVP
ncbi:MAG: HAD family hydrolase, partial [Candidatus Nanohalobium sp.]